VTAYGISELEQTPFFLGFYSLVYHNVAAYQGMDMFHTKYRYVYDTRVSQKVKGFFYFLAR